MLFENFHSETVKSGCFVELHSHNLFCFFLPNPGLGRTLWKDIGIWGNTLLRGYIAVVCYKGNFLYLAAAGVTMVSMLHSRWHMLFWGVGMRKGVQIICGVVCLSVWLLAYGIIFHSLKWLLVLLICFYFISVSIVSSTGQWPGL